MSIRLVLNDRAVDQLENAYQWWSQNRSASQAGRWYNGILSALDSLRINPERCSIAVESAQFSCEVRQLLFGLGKRPTHRVLFTIRPDMVYVFSIRHVSQDFVDPDEL